MSPTLQRARGVRYKTLDASIQEVTGRHIEFIASQEVLDRDGDVIEVAGIGCTDFMRNPLFLGDHDKGFILGKVIKLWKERLPGGPALLAKAELLPAGISARADERYAAIKFGAAKGISIGFLARARKPIPTGYRYTGVDLMEVSQVSIPSCPTCVITSKSAQQQMRSTASHHEEDDMDTEEMWVEIDDGIETKDDDAFEQMCRQMLAAYSEMDSDKFLELMRVQLATLGPAGKIDDFVRAMCRDGVAAPKYFDVDERQLGRLIAEVLSEEAANATKAAINSALGRLD